MSCHTLKSTMNTRRNETSAETHVALKTENLKVELTKKSGMLSDILDQRDSELLVEADLAIEGGRKAGPGRL